jgi:hypothetical protein
MLPVVLEPIGVKPPVVSVFCDEHPSFGRSVIKLDGIAKAQSARLRGGLNVAAKVPKTLNPRSRNIFVSIEPEHCYGRDGS